MSRYIYYRLNQLIPVIIHRKTPAVLNHPLVVEYALCECFPSLLTLESLVNQTNQHPDQSSWKRRFNYATANELNLQEKLKHLPTKEKEQIQELMAELKAVDAGISQIYMTLYINDTLDDAQLFWEEMRLLELFNFDLDKYLLLRKTRGNLSFLQATDLAQLMLTQDSITQIHKEAGRNMDVLVETYQNDLMVQYKTLYQLHTLVHNQIRELTQEMNKSEIAKAVKAVNLPTLRLAVNNG